MEDLDKKAQAVTRKILKAVGLEPSFEDEVDIEHETYLEHGTTPRTGVPKGTSLPVGGLIRVRNRPDLFAPHTWYLGIVQRFSHKDLVFKFYAVEVVSNQRIYRLVVPDTDIDISVPMPLTHVPPSERTVSP